MVFGDKSVIRKGLTAVKSPAQSILQVFNRNGGTFGRFLMEMVELS